MSMSMRPQSATEPASDARFRILSIDGGGIRGIIPAVLLEALEGFLAQALRAASEREAEPWRERSIDEPRIADCFDLVAGTSTGGLLTAALTVPDESGRPKLTAAQALDIYVSKGPAIFARPLLRNVFDHFGLLWPKYPLEQLRKVLAEPALFGEARLAQACTDVLLASYDTTHTTPRLFTPWDEPGAGSQQPAPPTLTMVDVALASAAAPTYFNPEHVERAHYVDGGVFAGNPAIAALSLALRRTAPPGPIESQDVLMLSLGTGSWEQSLDYCWGGILGWLLPRKGGEALLEALLNGQTDSASEYAHIILNGWNPPDGGAWWESALPNVMVGDGPRFWRYQPPLPEPWAMDDTSNIQGLLRVGRDAVANYEDELRRLAHMLVAKGPV
jgi:uncharacterized protein